MDGWIDTLGPESATFGISLLKFFGGLVFIAGISYFYCILYSFYLLFSGIYVGTPDISKHSLFENAQSIHGIFLGRAHLNGKQAKEDLVAVGKEVKFQGVIYLVLTYNGIL